MPWPSRISTQTKTTQKMIPNKSVLDLEIRYKEDPPLPLHIATNYLIRTQKIEIEKFEQQGTSSQFSSPR